MGRPGSSRVRHSGNAGWLFRTDARPKKSDRDERYVSLRITGREASITWGYHVAAVLSSWHVVKNKDGDEWTLTGTAERIDPFCLRQTQPTLLFCAGPAQPCWPIRELGHDGTRVKARLGPVEF